MKRLLCLLLAVCMTLSLCACGKDSEKDAGNDTLSSNEEASAPTESIPTPKEQETPGESKPSHPSAGKVDVDLTVLSSTMVYSEVFNMTNAPEKYIGKTVRMRGKFSVYENTQTGARYFACVIADATSCCSQGIEFAPDLTEISSLTVGSEITVRGEFSAYEEDGTRYCRLKNAHLE
mgnify:CR=1 FL=1